MVKQSNASDNLCLIELRTSQAPQAQYEHGQQKYKDLYENPDKKLEKKREEKKEKSQLKSLTLLPSWIASFLCGYFPDLTQFEPFLNFVVVNGYNKIPRLETKFSGANKFESNIPGYNISTATISHQNQLTKIELSFQPTINAIAVLQATSGSEYCNKIACTGGALSPKWPWLQLWITN